MIQKRAKVSRFWVKRIFFSFPLNMSTQFNVLITINAWHESRRQALQCRRCRCKRRCTAFSFWSTPPYFSSSAFPPKKRYDYNFFIPYAAGGLAVHNKQHTFSVPSFLQLPIRNDIKLANCFLNQIGGGIALGSLKPYQWDTLIGSILLQHELEISKSLNLLV